MGVSDPDLVRKTKIEIFQAVVALDPKAPVFPELAEALIEDGQPDEAIVVCRRGLVYHPDLLAGRVALVEALERAGRAEEAKEALGEAKKQADVACFGLDRLADLEERLDKLKKTARSMAQESAEDGFPPGGEVEEAPVELPSSTLAYLYLRQGESKAAIRVYERLMEKEPDNEVIRSKLEALRAAANNAGPKKLLGVLEKWRAVARKRMVPDPA